MSGVLHVVRDTDRRGAQVFAYELCVALGSDSRLVALERGDDPKGLPIPVLGPRSLHPRTLLALRQAARSAHVVVAHGSRTAPACAVALARLRTPLIYRSIGNIEDWASAWLRRARVRAYLRRASVVVALWPAAADTIVRELRVPARRVRVIPNAVDPSRWRQSDRAAARWRLSIDEDVPVVAYVGALSEEKQVHLAAEAVAGGVLLVVGDGPERERIARLAPRAIFTGRIDNPAEALAAADVVVLPSRTEGLPAVAIEAGMMGLPVVASDVGGLREIVVDGQTGMLVPPGDVAALRDALHVAVSRREELGSAARERCHARFSIGVVASQWGALLRELGA